MLVMLCCLLGFLLSRYLRKCLGYSSFSRRVTSTASVYFSLGLMILFLFQCWDLGHLIRNCPNIAASSTSSDRPPTRG